MNVILYISIFSLKVLENCLATIRIILISNGKKNAGSILIFLISLLWIVSTSVTVININRDIFKIFVFSFGSLIGSYLGSFLEEKIALGNILTICITSSNIENYLRNNGYILTSIKGQGFKRDKKILFIASSRKEKINLTKKIIELDKHSMIITENININ